MGNDLTVVNAARVSFAKQKDALDNKDTNLIKYLAQHHHWTPFSHVMLQFRIKMPIFVAREWYRHTVGLSRNEESRRYVTDPPSFFIPTHWRKKAEDKKQGSSLETLEGIDARIIDDAFRTALGAATDAYNTMINMDVAPEMARMVLPQNMYTSFIETGSLAAYARIYGLRHAPDAMEEIQLYAKAIDSLVPEDCHFSWEALTS